jgi:hypothetical protein
MNGPKENLGGAPEPVFLSSGRNRIWPELEKRSGQNNPRNSTIFASANNCRGLSIIFEFASAIFFAEARNEITLNSFGNYFGTLRHSRRQL